MATLWTVPFSAWVADRGDGRSGKTAEPPSRALGTSFSLEKAYVQWNTGIAANEQRGEFAVARSKAALVCKAEDIFDVRLGPAPNPLLGGQTFSLDAKSESLPNIRFDTVGTMPILR